MLVPDVSQRDIEIAYSFTGAELLLFGAILYPGGRVPDDEPADIVVVVKGPVQSVLMREKQKIAGIWINAEQSALPFGAELLCDRLVAADRRDSSTNARVRSTNWGSTACSSRPHRPRRPTAGSFPARARRAQARAGLYVEAPRAVEITDGVLYRARLTIPARVPVGRFTAETFLIRDGRVLAAAGGIADPQVGVRTLRGAVGAAPVGRLWAGRGRDVGRDRLGRGIRRPAYVMGNGTGPPREWTGPSNQG